MSESVCSQKVTCDVCVVFSSCVVMHNAQRRVTNNTCRSQAAFIKHKCAVFLTVHILHDLKCANTRDGRQLQSACLVCSRLTNRSLPPIQDSHMRGLGPTGIAKLQEVFIDHCLNTMGAHTLACWSISKISASLCTVFVYFVLDIYMYRPLAHNCTCAKSVILGVKGIL